MLKAARIIQGAVRRLAVPCFNSSPKLGVGGGKPKPRKSRAVIAVIAPTMVKGISVIKVERMFGRMWWKIIRLWLAPKILAAAT